LAIYRFALVCGLGSIRVWVAGFAIVSGVAIFFTVSTATCSKCVRALIMATPFDSLTVPADSKYGLTL
jgi:hypothetical protein